MKNDDYGFYGKGLDGYVHYRQGMQEAARNAPNASGGRRPVSAEQKTTEPAPIFTSSPTLNGPSTFAPELTTTRFPMVGCLFPVSFPVPPSVTP